MEPQTTPPYVPAQVVDPASRGPIRVVIEPPRYGWIGRGFRWLVAILLVLIVISFYYTENAPITEEWYALEKSASDKIAVITVSGTIFGDESFVKDQINRVRDDRNVKAVVLRVDSPGGTITATDSIYHDLKKLIRDREIPLVVSMGGMAASGGYYVAMAAGDVENTIYAEPTTWTGSIGVIIPHYNVSKLFERWDIQDDSIASNPLKMMGSPTRVFPEPIRAEEQKIFEGLVQSSFDAFKEVVLASRPALRENKDKQEIVFTGRIFTARQAQENLLVDRLGYIEDAIDRAIELANLDKLNVEVVRYKRPLGTIETLLLGPQSRPQRIDLASLVELTVPKAYYLCTWLPALAGIARP
jgi:protease IV